MAVSNVPVFPQLPRNGKVQIVNADGTTLKTVYTADADGSKIVGLMATSTDSAARVVEVGIENGGTFYQLGAVNVPIDAGSITGTAAVNLMSMTSMPGLPVDNDGQPYLLLISGDTLKVRVQVAVTAAETINVTAIGADF
jgi:hypothetical protein